MSPAQPEPAGRRRPIHLTFLLLVAVVALFVWRSGRLGPPEVVPLDQLIVPTPVVPDTKAPREGYFSPDFEARTLSGEMVRLSGMRGKAVFLNFWAPWCAPCRAEMKAIGRLAEEAPAGISLLTIALDSQRDAVERFVEKYEIGFPVVHDADRELGTKFEVAGIPTTIVLDGRGLVVKRIVGPRAWDHPDFAAWLAALADAEAQ